MEENKENKETAIHLPQTEFPMKGNLNKREPEFLAAWEKDRLYENIMKKREGRPLYVLHDGPPYANGNIHMGHVLNKVLKDITVRYKNFKGFKAPYVPGWDCHGMPIEHKVVEDLGSKKEGMSKADIRKRCHEYAMKYVGIQREQFKRLGCMGKWEDPYLTLNTKYEDKMVDIFWEMYRKGMVYKGLKPVYWCYDCMTALAEAEVEYKDHKTPSVYVRFAVKDSSAAAEKLPPNTYIVIWTTTPWTLPANVAIALHPEFDYALIEHGNDKYVVADALLGEFSTKTSIKEYRKIKTFKGKALEHTVAAHPFINRDSKVINADYVTLETGTGCVHIAPGHGHDDYVSSLKYKLPILNPVDDRGRFTDEFPEMKGEFVFKANPKVVELLKSKGALLGEEEITHSYPHCWRCKKPIIFRATKQWFISMDKNNFREKALHEIKGVKWLNEWGETRITKMIEGRPDWCVSRQRSWGVPIFAFSCADCGEIIVTEKTTEKVHELIKAHGSDGWFTKEASEILGADFKCPKCGSGKVEKEKDIFDVWFDSGASSFAVLENYDELHWPADLYLEGSDQYRGWFQSSLLTAVGYREKAPFKAVISTGWIVDGQGRAMHKSLGNVVDPIKLIEKGGADILRLWVASENFTTDQPISDEILARVTDSYRRIRNTFRFMLGNLFDFKRADVLAYNKLTKFDRYALHRLQETCDNMEKHYESFEFYKVYSEFTKFCSTFLSSFYFDVLKDRLYTYRKDGRERRSAQTVIYKMTVKLLKRIAPILAFTADEAWQFMPAQLKDEPHVHLTEWTDEPEKKLADHDVERWDVLVSLRDAVMKQAEIKRGEGLIKHPYETAVTIKYSSKQVHDVVAELGDELAEILIVSKAELVPSGPVAGAWDQGLEITVSKAAGEKCGRCWRYEDSVGKVAGHPTLCKRCADNL